MASISSSPTTCIGQPFLRAQPRFGLPYDSSGMAEPQPVLGRAGETRRQRFHIDAARKGQGRDRAVVDGAGEPADQLHPGIGIVEFHPTPEMTLAQVEEAPLAAGLDVTHLDAHMGSVMCPEFVEIYLRLGKEHRLPILLVQD